MDNVHCLHTSAHERGEVLQIVAIGLDRSGVPLGLRSRDVGDDEVPSGIFLSNVCALLIDLFVSLADRFVGYYASDLRHYAIYRAGKA